VMEAFGRQCNGSTVKTKPDLCCLTTERS